MLSSLVGFRVNISELKYYLFSRPAAPVHVCREMLFSMVTFMPYMTLSWPLPLFSPSSLSGARITALATAFQVYPSLHSSDSSSPGLRCPSQVPAALLLPTCISQSPTPPPSTPQELVMWSIKRVRPFHRGEEGGRDLGFTGRAEGEWGLERLESSLRPVRDLGGKLGGLLSLLF